jgi:hypothetical protein
MLNALKKLFGIKAAEKAEPTPYKVEKPAEFPFPSAKPAKSKKKPAVKKPAVKKSKE